MSKCGSAIGWEGPIIYWPVRSTRWSSCIARWLLNCSRTKLSALGLQTLGIFIRALHVAIWSRSWWKEWYCLYSYVQCTSKLGALWAPNFGGSARALVCSFLLVTTFINGNIGKVHIYLIVMVSYVIYWSRRHLPRSLWMSIDLKVLLLY